MNKGAGRAVVIGSGVAGLAVALRLQAKGYQVDVYETADVIGGKLGFFEEKGYRFDTGPSLFTLPHLLTETIRDTGLNPDDYFSYAKHPVACHYFWPDGTFLQAKGELKAFAADIEKTFDVPKGLIYRYFREAESKYTKTKGVFLERSLHRLKTYFTADVWRAIPSLPFLDLFKSLHAKNKSYFTDPRLVQLFDRFATYNGSNPYQTPGIMQLIAHLEHGIGTFFPKGGMRSIPMALYEAGKTKGVCYHTGTKVDKICYTGKKVRGVEVGGQFIPASVVVSNADIRTTYNKLLADFKAPTKVMAQESSSSALIFYWGIRKKFPQLDLHNIFFSEDYKAEFDQIFTHKKNVEDPTIYIHISSRVEEKDAPAEGENWFVMINVPANEGQDWDREIPRLRKIILQKIQKIVKEDVEPLIEVERHLDPRLIESKTASYKGALYGSASNNRMAAFFRQANFSKQLHGLYFCGGSVHPGGGIPLCLHSASITSDMISILKS